MALFLTTTEILQLALNEINYFYTVIRDVIVKVTHFLTIPYYVREVQGHSEIQNKNAINPKQIYKNVCRSYIILRCLLMQE